MLFLRFHQYQHYPGKKRWPVKERSEHVTRWSTFGKFEESLSDGDTENMRFKFGEAEHLSSF